jgi:hypothetical protein
MNITLIITDDFGITTGMKIVNLEHLVRILTFQTEEKGMTVFGSLSILNGANINIKDEA